jgi:RNA polymerase sigma-70 factor (ECF subfamily)
VLRDPEAAAEVLQEVFWQVWREAPRYDPERGSPEAWLVTRAPRPGWASRSAP